MRDKVEWSLFKSHLEIEQIRNLAFDAKHGSDTAGEIYDLEEIGVPTDLAERSTFCRAFWEPQFAEIMSKIALAGCDLSRFTFIDYGSGKGKILLLASHYPFQRIIGVEFSSYLHDIACRNCNSYEDEGRRCQNIQLVLADALAFAPPPDPLIAFIFNSFDVPTTRQVLQTLDGLQQGTVVIYANLRGTREMLPAFDGLSRLRLMINQPEYVVYS